MNEENKKNWMRLLTDNSSVPNVLLDHYREMGLSAEETLFLIVLLRLQQKRSSLTFRVVARESVYTEKEVMAYVPILLDTGFLSLGNEREIHIDGLVEKFLEVCSWQAIKAEQKIRKDQKSTKEDKTFADLYACFEQEMGRLLSPMEGEQITYWYKNQSISPEVIKEGLRRAVLLNKNNFRYIDAILRSWKDRGIQSLADLEKAEREQKKQAPEKSGGHRIFRGEQDQEEILSDDIYEVF